MTPANGAGGPPRMPPPPAMLPNAPLPGQMPGPMMLPPGMDTLSMNQQPQGAPMGVPPESVIAQALKLLRQGRAFDFRVSVDSDTLVEPDLTAEREERNTFLQTSTSFMQQMLPAVQATPQLAPLMQAFLMFGVRSYHCGRDLEGIIESTMQAMASAPPKEPPPDPKVEALKAKTQADMQLAQQKGQLEQQKAQQDGAAKQQQMQMDMQKMQMEMQQMQAEIQAEREKAQGELQVMMQKAQAEIQIMREKAANDLQIAQQKAEADTQTSVIDTALNAHMQQQEHESAMERRQEEHMQGLEQSEQAATVQRELMAEKPKPKAKKKK